MSEVFSPLAYILIILGFIGTLLPLMPGTVVIWLGIVVWAWADAFRHIGWLTLAALTFLLIVGWAADLVASTAFSRKSGASWKAIIASMVCGLIGALFLSEFPIVGTIAGALIGALVGMLAVEFLVTRDFGQALRASASYFVGSLASKIFEIIVGLLMIGIFVWRAFF